MIDLTVVQLLTGERKLKEWLALHTLPTMIDGGGADTGGQNKFPHGIFTWKPSIQGDATAFSFAPKPRPKGQPWDNIYLYNTLSKGKLDYTYFSHQLSFAFPTSAAINNCTAFEFELELCEAGLTYNMGWQYKHSKVDGPPSWRYFNKQQQAWVAVPTLPIPAPMPNTFVSIVMNFAVNRAAKLCTHDSIVIDGIFHPVNQTLSAVPKWNPTTWYLHNAVQLDSDGKGSPETILLNNMNVRAL